MDRAIGSMMRVTAKAPLTGIRGLLRGLEEGVQVTPSDRERVSAAARSRADKTLLVEVGSVGALIAGAAEGKQPLLSGEVAKVLLEEVSAAVT